MALRDVAEALAEFIRDDVVLHDDGHITVVVEDKATVHFEVENALAGTGVCVLISMLGFQRVDRSPILQGNLNIQISCFENPELNRTDDSILTAQATMERIADILHYTKFPFFIGQMIFNDFSRDDTDDVNIVRGNFTVNTKLGYERQYCRGETETTQE